MCLCRLFRQGYNFEGVGDYLKESCAAAVADDEDFDVSAPDAMCVRSSVPSQPPRIDESKVQSPEAVASLVKKLKISRSHSGASSSKD